MIKSLELFNFQSHAHTLIEFSDGVNIISGTSDSGKSAILRALRWVIRNEPSGLGVVSWWVFKGKRQKEDCKVILTLDDDKDISIHLLKFYKINVYSIDYFQGSV